jgi:uncharacterized membrane protein
MTIELPSPIKRYGPERAVSFILALVVLTMGSADYWAYSKSYHEHPSVFQDVIQGTAGAPEQYRVGVIDTAAFVSQHAHLALRHIFTLIDVAAAFLAVFVLLFLLRRSKTYQTAGKVSRWLGLASFVALVQFYFAWVTSYQRVETLPTSAFVALTLLLLTVKFPFDGVIGGLATALAMVILAAAQGFVRADVAFALHLGVLLVCLTRTGGGTSLSRLGQAATSLTALVAATGIQFYMMKVAYPHATYGDTPIFQLLLNLKDIDGLATFALFIPPYIWMVRTLMTRKFEATAPALSVVYGSAVFLGLWWMVGRVEETRIFLPFALALVPLTVEMIMRRVEKPTA